VPTRTHFLIDLLWVGLSHPGTDSTPHPPTLPPPAQLRSVHTVRMTLSAQFPDRVVSAVDVIRIRRGIDAKVRFCGPDHPESLLSINALLDYYVHAGTYEIAITEYERALEHRRGVFGHDHPDTLAMMDGLGEAYNKVGKAADALDVLEDCYRIRQTQIAHPDTLRTLRNLSSTYERLGKTKEADDTAFDCHDIAEIVYGMDHPHTLTCLQFLGARHALRGQLEKAFELYEKCFEMRKRILGVRHLETISSMIAWSEVCYRLSNIEKAKQLCEGYLEAASTVLDSEHPDILEGKYNLAALYRKLGLKEEALRIQIESFESRTRVLGPDNASTIQSMVELDRLNYPWIGACPLSFEIAIRRHAAKRLGNVLGHCFSLNQVRWTDDKVLSEIQLEMITGNIVICPDSSVEV